MLGFSSISAALHLRPKGTDDKDSDKNLLPSESPPPYTLAPVRYQYVHFGIGGAGNIRKVARHDCQILSMKTCPGTESDVPPYPGTL